MKKIALLAPLALLALVTIFAIYRRPEKSPQPHRQVTTPSTVKTPSQSASAEPRIMRKTTPDEQGRSLHHVTLRSQLGIYLRATSTGDLVTARAMETSFRLKPEDSREIVHERLTVSTSAGERDLLNNLLRQLP